MKTKNEQKGITLVALVITIIILLILAGISIASLTQTGLFEKTKDAKQKSENAQAEENATLENYMAQIDEITGGKKTDSEQSTYTAYNVGDTVALKSNSNEQFYVLEASDTNTDTVKLITKYNLNTAGTAQAPNAKYGDTACAFSADGGFSANEDLNENATVLKDTTSAVYKANKYAKTCGATKGRLLTKEEVDALKSKINNEEDSDGKIAKMLWGQENTQSDGKYLYYWLGSAYDDNNASRVWGVVGSIASFNGGSSYSYGSSFGVRPVIEISKSLIQ